MNVLKLLRQTQDWIEQSVTSKGYDEATLKQSRHWAESITWSLIATAGLSISWLTLAKTEEIVIAPGTLVPVGSVQRIQMPMGGVVEKILVKDGDMVKKGQILMQLDAEATTQRLKSVEENMELKQLQLELKNTELEQYIIQNKNSLRTLAGKLKSEKDILERLQSLAGIGASAVLQYLQQQSKVQQIEGQLKETELEGLRQQAVLMQDIQRLKSEVSSLRSDLVDNKMTLRYQVLRAPVTGFVFDLQPKGQGFTGQGTETLMKIVPVNALEAKVEIPSSDIGFVRKGMDADISIDSFPASDFGVLAGKVMQVGPDALEPDPSRQLFEYRYPATINLSNQTLTLKSGKELMLQPGMSLRANIKLRKVSYLQLLLGGFQDKANSLREI